MKPAAMMGSVKTRPDRKALTLSWRLADLCLTNVKGGVIE
ncbi:hypothetical protein SD77_3045 [Bacillus badius]|uniref:Uncharacterized protein n=1 Tax=Bacillus badius TaxID=1455 RepID=A0ABR5AWZ6_BACBA|nr:hypothetical protein SD78_0359 [Bacillus badius]KIL79179.1 hypothetical protein SD77_3045 [Bacillus badius]